MNKKNLWKSMQNPWVFYTFVKNSWIFIILNFILWQIKNEFPKLMQMHFQKMKMHLQNSWKCISKIWKCICKIQKCICKIHENAFSKIGNPFAKSMKCICKIHENAFAKSMKMHLQNPQFFFGICNFANAFPKSKV